jgi:hypothetical protein
MFASHPPQRTEKDGASFWSMGLKAKPAAAYWLRLKRNYGVSSKATP